MGKSKMIPREIVKLRAYMDYSQEDLAQVLDVKVETVKRWEKGTSQPNEKARILMQILDDPELTVKLESLLGTGKAVRAELIGYIPVETGQIVMGDPCFLKYWSGGDYKTGKKCQTNDYEGVSNITLETKYGEHRLVQRAKDHINHIVASTVPGGDGMCPVFAIYEKGMFSRLEIRFDEY